MTQFDESQWFHDLAQEVYVVLLCDIKHFMRIIHGNLFANTLSIGEIFMWVGVALLKLFASWLEKKTVLKVPMTRNFTLICRRPYAPYRLRRRLLITNSYHYSNQGKRTIEFS